MIAPTNDAVAAVTNVTWDSGTTAIISDASSPDTCKGGRATTAAFIYKAYPQLEREIAAGSGEYLDRLARLTTVPAEKKVEVVSTIRQGMAQMVADSRYSQMSRFQKAEALYNVVISASGS